MDLEAFVEKYCVVSVSCDVSLSDVNRLFADANKILCSNSDKSRHHTAITAIKIITRLSQFIDDLFSRDNYEILMEQARILPVEPVDVFPIETEEQRKTVILSLSCLNNLILQSAKALSICQECGILAGGIKFFDRWEEYAMTPELLHFQGKILFLVTAKSVQARGDLHANHNGLVRLTEFMIRYIDKILQEKDVVGAVGGEPKTPRVTSEQGQVLGEVLKVIFNMSMKTKKTIEEDADCIRKLNQCLHTLFTIRFESEEARRDLQTQCIHLLTTVDGKTTNSLLQKLNEEFADPNLKPIVFNQVHMNVPKILLDHLVYNIDMVPKNEYQEGLSPVLTVLLNLSREHRQVRKYLRREVLPPLDDVKQRPEVGNKVRNKLVRLLTSPLDQVCFVAGEFLFILCKESVSRFIKYVGYGNAAGYLNKKALFGMQKHPNEDNYSEDSDDSDTEEYLKYLDKINPVVGSVEDSPPGPSFKDLSEEQKLAEVDKMATLLQQMNDLGVIQPAVPGEDGRPRPVQHVLELRDIMEQERNKRNGEEENANESD